MTCFHRERWYAGVAAVVAAFAGIACSTEEPLPPGERGDTSEVEESRFGSVVAEFNQTPGATASPVEVDAQFLDTRGVGHQTALGALEVWHSSGSLAEDSCQVSKGVATRAQSKQERTTSTRLRLLSVGPITVDGPDRRLELRARRLPDLSSAFSGVVYGTERTPSDEKRRKIRFENDANYTIRAPGDGATGGFEVSLTAPEPIAIDRISGLPGADGHWDLAADDNELQIRWNESTGDRHDVYLDVAAGPGPDHPRLQCRLEDDGLFSLPAEIPAELVRSTETLDVTLRRVDTRHVDVEGLEHTEFVLSTVDRRRISLD